MNFLSTQSGLRGPLIVLIVFSLALFVVPAVKDRGLTIHEAVLPQSARSMYYDSDFVVPKRGTAPWLENPPLPQWFTVGLCHLVGSCDEVWIARLGVAIAGTALVVTVVFIGATLFNPATGILSGFVMATSYQVIRYSSLAEDEIYLALMVALAVLAFVRAEFRGPPVNAWKLMDVVNNRSAVIWCFFLLVGMTNLTKGLVFGPVMALIPVGFFLLLTLDVHRIMRYVWLWGIVLFFLVAGLWPYFLLQRHPDVLELWGFDLFGRLSGSYTDINQPVWYYGPAIIEAIAPWILIAPLGLMLTFRAARSDASSPERFLWIWAIFFPLVLTIPSGKHHHYLLHGLVPWAIINALALQWLWRRYARPGWSARMAGVVLFSLLGVLFATAQWLYRGTHHDDAVMLRKVQTLVPADAQIIADMDVIGLRQFHTLMYLPADTIPIHNLTYLRDKRITDEVVYLVTRHRKRTQMDPYGDYTVLLQSDRTDRSSEPDALLTLYELKLHPGIQKLDSSDVYISPMQAMHRDPGPYLPSP